MDNESSVTRDTSQRLVRPLSAAASNLERAGVLETNASGCIASSTILITQWSVTTALQAYILADESQLYAT